MSNLPSTATSVLGAFDPTQRQPRYLFLSLSYWNMEYIGPGSPGSLMKATPSMCCIDCLILWADSFLCHRPCGGMLPISVERGRLGEYSLNWQIGITLPTLCAPHVLFFAASPALYYILVCLMPHFAFTRRPPVGVAGLLACCFRIAGTMIRMSQVWYAGPVGKLAGAAWWCQLIPCQSHDQNRDEDYNDSVVTLCSLSDWRFAHWWSLNSPLQSSFCEETWQSVDTSSWRHRCRALYSLLFYPQTYIPPMQSQYVPGAVDGIWLALNWAGLSYHFSEV